MLRVRPLVMLLRLISPWKLLTVLLLVLMILFSPFRVQTVILFRRFILPMNVMLGRRNRRVKLLFVLRLLDVRLVLVDRFLVTI